MIRKNRNIVDQLDRNNGNEMGRVNCENRSYMDRSFNEIMSFNFY